MGAQKPPMMAGFQAEENLTGRASKKMCEKLWTLSNFSAVSQRDLYWKGVYRINNRPRKVLGWKTAQECFAEELRNST